MTSVHPRVKSDICDGNAAKRLVRLTDNQRI